MAIRKTSKTASKETVTYEILETCGVISTGNNRWRTELRLISWSGKEPKYDIRSWKDTEDGERCGKGITLTGEELEELGNIIDRLRKE